MSAGGRRHRERRPARVTVLVLACLSLGCIATEVWFGRLSWVTVVTGCLSVVTASVYLIRTGGGR